MASASEELGNATILGGSINPLQVYMGQQAARERDKVAKLKAYQDARDKYTEEELKYKTEPVNIHDRAVIEAEANNLRQRHLENYDRLGHNKSKVQAAKDWSDLNVKIDQANQIHNAHKEAYDILKSDPTYNFTDAFRALNDKRDAVHERWKVGGMNPDDDSFNDVLTNPKYYNKAALVKNHIDTLHENSNDYLSKQTDAYGNHYTNSQISSQLPYETEDQIDPLTGLKTKNWKLDERGDKIIKMNPTLFQSVKSNPKLNQVMEMEAGANAEDQKKWIMDNLTGRDKSKRNVTLQNERPIKENESDSQDSSIVGSGDNALKPYDQIGQDKKLGFDSIAFGYSSDKEIPFSTTQGGSADATGKFSGLRTNPSTGKKEMEFITSRLYGAPGEKEIKYVPYDEKTFEQTLNSLPPKKRPELLKLKKDFDKQYDNKKEYVLDEGKLNQEADSIDKFYTDNKDNVGTPEFDNKFNSLLNSLGINEGKSKKNFWFWQDNELKIGDKTVPVGDKEQLKQALYDIQKGRYKKAAGVSEPKTTEKVKIPGF